MTFVPIIIIMHIYNWYQSVQQAFFYIHNHRLQYTRRIPLAFLLPLLISPCSPFAPPSNPLLLTWNPPSCDRIRPPRSQVACKLTSPFPTLSPNPPPSKFPESQVTQRLTKTTIRRIRRLLSGTITNMKEGIKIQKRIVNALPVFKRVLQIQKLLVLSS
jgi:hypothetical protein